jgi:hypothetical protein
MRTSRLFDQGTEESKIDERKRAINPTQARCAEEGGQPKGKRYVVSKKRIR